MIAGHLSQKKGYWYAVLNLHDDEGRRKSKWIATHLPVKGNKKRAEEILTELRIQYTSLENSQLGAGGMLLSSYMENWLAGMENKLSPSTFSSYHSIVQNSICPYFQERGIRLCDAKPGHIEEYYEHLRRRGVSNNTIIKHHNNIHKALRDAYRKELLPADVADRLERPRKEDFVAHPYTAEEACALLEAIKGEKLETVVLLALFYGLRRSEVLGLRWCVIDFERDAFVVNHTVTQVQTQGVYTVIARDKAKRSSSFRTMPLMPDIREYLIQLKMAVSPKENDYICIDAKGKPIKPNYVSLEFPELLRRHGLRPIRFHDLRHSCANLLIGERVPLIEVSQWLGHSNIATTADLYAHLDFSTKQNSANTIKKI